MFHSITIELLNVEFHQRELSVVFHGNRSKWAQIIDLTQMLQSKDVAFFIDRVCQEAHRNLARWLQKPDARTSASLTGEASCLLTAQIAKAPAKSNCSIQSRTAPALKRKPPHIR